MGIYRAARGIKGYKMEGEQGWREKIKIQRRAVQVEGWKARKRWRKKRRAEGRGRDYERRKM